MDLELISRSKTLLNYFPSVRPSVLVIIPAYNEALNITRVIHSIQEHAPYADILVIDDGSRDQTVFLAQSVGAMVVSHPFNMGYGVACQTGFKYAHQKGYEYVIQMDGDGQHEPACIPELLKAVQDPDVDVVLGSRWLGQGNYKGPLLRRFGKFFFAYLANLFTHLAVTDPTTGYQALSKQVVQFYCTAVYPTDYPDANMIILLDRSGFRVKEVPVIMYLNQTGQSMHSGILRPIYYGLKMMTSILMTMMRDDRNLIQPTRP